jgi:hypothetical protein
LGIKIGMHILTEKLLNVIANHPDHPFVHPNRGAINLAVAMVSIVSVAVAIIVVC